MKRVFIQTNIPVPYKVDFYNELGKMCDLTVVFEARRIGNQKFNWNDDAKKNFKAIYLNDLLDERKVNKGVLKFLNKDKFDIFVIAAFHTLTGQLAIWTLKIKNIPYCFETDGAFVPVKENTLKYFYKKCLISNACKYLSPSEISDRYLKHYGAKANNIYRYPFASTLNSEVLSKPLCEIEINSLREKYGIKEKYIIIAVGQFIKRKGFDILIKACSQLDNIDVGCFIIGGNPNAELLELTQSLKLSNIYFLPFQDRKTLSEYYQLSDVFVLPTREDIWGLVINEAMANGLPVITTDKCNAGLAMVSDKNGAIVPVDSIDSLVSSLKLIFSDNNKRLQMGKESLNIIKNYTIENMAVVHKKILLDE